MNWESRLSHDLLGGFVPWQRCWGGSRRGFGGQGKAGCCFLWGAGAQRAEHPRLGSGAALEQGRVLGTGHRYCLLDKSASLSSP